VTAAFVLAATEALGWIGERTNWCSKASVGKLIVALALMLGGVLATKTFSRNEVYYDHRALSPRVRLVRTL